MKTVFLLILTVPWQHTVLYALKRNGGGTISNQLLRLRCVWKRWQKNTAAKWCEHESATFTFQKPSNAMAQFSEANPVALGCIRNFICALMVRFRLPCSLRHLKRKARAFPNSSVKFLSTLRLRENITCRNEQKYKLVEQLGSTLKAAFPAYTDFSTVDGARLALKNGWLLVRASGTEPLIRLTVEGESQQAAKDITQKATALIHKQIEAQQK